MARPRKPRSCGCNFCGKAYHPAGRPVRDLERIPLFPDELEALRLCDLEGLTQQEAGRRMGVSRGTVQRMVKQARQKVAQALVEGGALIFTPRSGEEEP